MADLPWVLVAKLVCSVLIEISNEDGNTMVVVSPWLDSLSVTQMFLPGICKCLRICSSYAITAWTPLVEIKIARPLHS